MFHLANGAAGGYSDNVEYCQWIEALRTEFLESVSVGANSSCRFEAPRLRREWQNRARLARRIVYTGKHRC